MAIFFFQPKYILNIVLKWWIGEQSQGGKLCTKQTAIYNGYLKLVKKNETLSLKSHAWISDFIENYIGNIFN